MSLLSALLHLLALLLPLATLSTTYLYLYPAFHRCRFPSPSDNDLAPFRLLALGDPQLEGDTSLPYAPAVDVPTVSSFLQHIRKGDWQAVSHDSFNTAQHVLKYTLYTLRYGRKYIDLVGNDYYLAHIYRTLHWYASPTHVAVLGDLLGSQWIGDEEFAHRSWRFWNRVFKGAEITPVELLNPRGDGEEWNINRQVLGADSSWSRRILNVPGNHDVGYAGDVNAERIDRFEREFGPVNGDVVFSLPAENNETSPSIRLVLLNTMTFDGPALDFDIQFSTINFVNDAMTHAAPVETHHEALILLTHIPLHKPAGICVDEPLFGYYDEWSNEEDGEERAWNRTEPRDDLGHLREQNMLSPAASCDAILQGIFGMHALETAPARGMGRHGLILTGHDHEGCDVYHYANRSAESWTAQKWLEPSTRVLVENTDQPGIREVTVRSMMGEFGGNAALVSGWWNGTMWKIEVSNCSVGVQHVWWGVHILDFLTLVIALITLLVHVSGIFRQYGKPSGKETEEAKATKKDTSSKPSASKREHKS